MNVIESEIIELDLLCFIISQHWPLVGHTFGEQELKRTIREPTEGNGYAGNQWETDNPGTDGGKRIRWEPRKGTDVGGVRCWLGSNVLEAL